jgi:small subunit ribosomal protein S20
MANIKSAKKRMRVSATKHERNRVVRSAVKTRVARARRVIDGGGSPEPEVLVGAISSLDQAAEKGILHRNNAARRKSRLMLAANRAAALLADPEAAAQAAAEARSRAKGSGKSGRKASAKSES